MEKKFKLKKIRISRTEKTIVLSLILLILSISLLLPIKSNDRVVKYNNSFKTPEFNGEKIEETTFGKRYINYVYSLEGEIQNHLVDVKTGKELQVGDIIKSESIENFENKIIELLNYKYPDKYTAILWNEASKKFVLYDSYMQIYFDTTGLIDTKRVFDLKIYYNEIADFIIIETEKVENPIRDMIEYDANKVTVSFTYDDGPNGKKTQKLIDAFEDYTMSATFFMVGNKLANGEQTVKYVANSHSEIGYHSFNHSYFTKQSAYAIQKDFNVSNSLLKEICGLEFKLTRPPYGDYNQTVLDSIDSIFVRWNLDTNDWRYKDEKYIENYVLENIEDGSIILFHDSYDTSINASLSLIDKLFLEDIQVVNVSKLANLKGQTLENHKMYYSFIK